MILDEDDQKSLLHKAYADLGYSLKDLKISSVIDYIGGRKAADINYVSLFAELPFCWLFRNTFLYLWRAII
jgi:DNA helicase-2/ATP-dependent DNA helicase PcrA